MNRTSLAAAPLVVLAVGLGALTGTPWWQARATGSGAGSERVSGASLDAGLTESVSGRAVGPGGGELRGVTLSLRMRPSTESGDWGVNHVVRTDDAGAFEARLAPGSYEARLFPAPNATATGSEGLWYDPVTFEVDPNADETPLALTFDQGLGELSVTGTVLVTGSHPVVGAHFQLHAVQPGVTFENRHYYQVKGTASSDERGRFTIGSLPSGSYMLTRVGEIPSDPRALYVDTQDRLMIELDADDVEIVWSVDAHVPGKLVLSLERENLGANRLGVVLDLEGWPAMPLEQIFSRDTFVFERVVPGSASVSLFDLSGDVRRELSSQPVTVLAGQTVRLEFP